MSSILQGTTPTVNFHIKPEDLDISTVTDLKLVFVQNTKLRKYKIVKRKADCDILPQENIVTYHFTEAETLGLEPRQSVSYQFLFQVADEILGTRAKKIEVEGLIDDEVTFDGKPYRRNSNCC